MKNLLTFKGSKIDRRKFLKIIGTGIVGFGSTSLFGPGKLMAANKEFTGVLVDTTRCIGCRSCEVACAEANNLPVPDMEDKNIFDKRRRESTTQRTVVNRYRTGKGDVYVKTQCMHCSQPACVAACLVNAMKKNEEGPVTLDQNCIGCRFCMFSCPFNIPKFEYGSPAPKIEKCNLCWERLKGGKIPACVEACPQETLLFGTKRDLYEEGQTRIYKHPSEYVHHIYGQYEVGGTCWIYLSKVPFEQIGFRTDLGTKAMPEFTMGFLYTVPFVDIILPLFLLGISRAIRKED